MTVTANATYGMATQRDADILRYAISKLAEAAFKRWRLYTISCLYSLRSLKSHREKQPEEELSMARRSIEPTCKHRVHHQHFSANPNREHKGPLATFEVLKDPETQEVAGIAVHFAPDVVSALKDRGILAVTDAVLLESGGMRKRLLEVIQVHMGENSKWEITLKELSRLCAFSRALKSLKERINRSELPYKITYRKGRTGQVVTFVKDASFDSIVRSF